MAKKNLRTVDDYKSEVTAIVRKELEDFDPISIRESIRGQLQSVAFDAVVSALGMSKRWGAIEVDHCNGNRGEAAKAMLSEAKTAAVDWFREQAGVLPTLPKSAIAALHKEYKEELENAISEILRGRAQHDAQRIVQEMFDGAAS